MKDLVNEVKEFLYWVAYGAILALQVLVFIALIANIVLPIILMVWQNSAWWVCLYLVEPVLMYLYVWLDDKTDDM